MNNRARSLTDIDVGNILSQSDGLSTRYMTATTRANDADAEVHYSTEVLMAFQTELASDYECPESFEEAIGGKDEDKWRPSIVSEVMNFIKRKSWVKVLREEAIKAGKTIMGTKVVFKIKTESDGSLRWKSRIVSKGFQMRRGYDYHGETFSPVCSQTGTRLTIAIALYHQDDEEPWTIELQDISAAFLEGEIEEPLYIEWPPGMVELGFISEKEKKKCCIKLVRGMYGNKDSALIYHRAFKKHVTKPEEDGGMGMEQSRIDPCIFSKRIDGEVKLIVNTHVDDCLTAGPKNMIEWVKEGIGKSFDYTDDGKLRKHLGVW